MFCFPSSGHVTQGCISTVLNMCPSPLGSHPRSLSPFSTALLQQHRCLRENICFFCTMSWKDVILDFKLFFGCRGTEPFLFWADGLLEFKITCIVRKLQLYIYGLDIWPENPHKVNGVEIYGHGRRVAPADDDAKGIECRSCRAGDVQMCLWNLVRLIGWESNQPGCRLDSASLLFHCLSLAHRQRCSAILRELAASAHAQNLRKGERQNEGERGEGGSKGNKAGRKNTRFTECLTIPSLLHTRGPFTVSHSTPLTALTAADLQSRLALLLCVALTVFADLFGGAVCVMCYVVLVSAGRNVLDSVPPTHCPPTHGRLCIYTSGSSRSPQSLCSFKSLSCIYPSALFLHRWLFRSAFLLQPNLHTHHAINKNVCIALHSERARRVSASEEKMLQSFFLIMSLVLYCSGRLASMFQVWLSTRKPQRQLWKSSRTFRDDRSEILLERETELFWNISQWENCCFVSLIFPPLNPPQKVRGACNLNKWSPRWFQHSVSPICAYILCYR